MHSTPEKNNEYQWLLLNYKPLQSGLKDGEMMEVKHSSNNVTSDINLDHRTLDEYLEEAYNFDQNHFIKRWKYMRMILALGLCGVGDATEMLSIGYVLADPTFQQQMMHNDMNKNGALVTSSLTAGMIVGALLVSFFYFPSSSSKLRNDYFSVTLYSRNNSAFFMNRLLF
jgi:hypothetical protein